MEEWLIKFFNPRQVIKNRLSMRAKPRDAKEFLDLLLGRSGTERNNPNKRKRSLDVFALLSLPEHLRKTAYAIHKTGRATSNMIARVTGMKVDNELSNLQELAAMGYLDIENKEGKVFFYIIT